MRIRVWEISIFRACEIHAGQGTAGSVNAMRVGALGFGTAYNHSELEQERGFVAGSF